MSIAESNGDGGGCRYSAPPTGPTGQLEVFVGIGAKTYYDTETRIGHTFKDVRNVGDEAHEEDSAIFARKGETWIAIRITTISDSATFVPKLRTLIAGAVDQL